MNKLIDANPHTTNQVSAEAGGRQILLPWITRMRSKRASISPPSCAIRGILGYVLQSMIIPVLLLAYTGCSTPPKIVQTDPEIERNVSMAKGAYAVGDAEKASVYYQKALQRARIMDAHTEIARNAYNLAACLASLRDYDAARECLDEARLEFQQANMTCPELPLLEAKIAHAQKRTQEAESMARAEQKKTENSNDAIRIQWHILLAGLLCGQGQAAAADAELAAINPKQLEASGTDIRAEAALTRAHVQMLKRNPQQAAIEYDRAAFYWQAAGRYLDMLSALELAGRAYENGGNRPKAMDRYYRAARGLFESGQLTRAFDLTTQALAMAAVAHQPELTRQAERLKASIETRRQTTTCSP